MINNSALLYMAGVCVVPLVLGGCQQARAETSAERPEYQGIVEYEERVLGFEVGGRIKDLKLETGDEVKANTELAHLDDGLERANRAGRLAEIHLAEAQ